MMDSRPSHFGYNRLQLTFCRSRQFFRTGTIWPMVGLLRFVQHHRTQCFDLVCVHRSIRWVSSPNSVAIAKFLANIPMRTVSAISRCPHYYCCSVPIRNAILYRRHDELPCNRRPIVDPMVHCRIYKMQFNQIENAPELSQMNVELRLTDSVVRAFRRSSIHGIVPLPFLDNRQHRNGMPMMTPSLCV